MDRYNYLDMYDHFYYPRKICIIVQCFITLGFAFFSLFYFNFYTFYLTNASFFKILFFLIVLILYFIFIVSLLVNAFFSVFRVNKIFVGINKDGLFIRYAGMFSWDELQTIEIKKGLIKGLEKINITIKRDASFYISLPKFLLRYYILGTLRIRRDGSLIIRACDVPISLSKLKNILDEYKKRFDR